MKPAERFLGACVASGRFLIAFSRSRIDRSRLAGLAGPGWTRWLVAARAASVLAASIFTFRIASSRVAATATAASAALALSAWRGLLVLMADAIAGSQGDLKLVKLVPLFLGTLVVGDRQQRLQAATRRGCVLFSHGGHYPISGAGGT
ncbi:MAG: hypothetical protein B7Y41_05550 [Hydrogenophilales bacterium 28-61-23]|nr:MAG: hypothetical protein B7Y41_05550 [Hydrogenophilales bacterium 28-61-23]